MKLTIESATEDAKAVHVAEGKTLTFETWQNKEGMVYFNIDLIDKQTTTAFLQWEGTKEEMREFIKEMEESIDAAPFTDE